MIFAKFGVDGEKCGAQHGQGTDEGIGKLSSGWKWLIEAILHKLDGSRCKSLVQGFPADFGFAGLIRDGTTPDN